MATPHSHLSDADSGLSSDYTDTAPMSERELDEYLDQLFDKSDRSYQTVIPAFESFIAEGHIEAQENPHPVAGPTNIYFADQSSGTESYLESILVFNEMMDSSTYAPIMQERDPVSLSVAGYDHSQLQQIVCRHCQFSVTIPQQAFGVYAPCMNCGNVAPFAYGEGLSVATSSQPWTDTGTLESQTPIPFPVAESDDSPPQRPGGVCLSCQSLMQQQSIGGWLFYETMIQKLEALDQEQVEVQLHYRTAGGGAQFLGRASVRWGVGRSARTLDVRESPRSTPGIQLSARMGRRPAGTLPGHEGRLTRKRNRGWVKTDLHDARGPPRHVGSSGTEGMMYPFEIGLLLYITAPIRRLCEIETYNRSCDRSNDAVKSRMRKLPSKGLWRIIVLLWVVERRTSGSRKRDRRARDRGHSGA
ncbi:hypothetical protein B0H11DRAFT_1907865 [Mycena galericulata]|nr:hypothetical protein B0H11DRAFT_1907865 [Mycena galericulata]